MTEALEQRKAGEADRRDRSRILVALAIVGLIIWFAFANGRRVRVDFLIFGTDARLIVVVAVSAVLGAIAGFLIGRRRRAR